MNNKATTQLKYKSYEELKSSALSNFDKKFLFTLKQLDINRLFKHFVEVERKARIRNFEGYLEESFMCYQRASEIFRLINDKMTPEFKRGQIGRDFFNIANDMVNAINLLTDKLKLEYNSLYGIEKMNVDEDYLNETSLTETIIFDTYVKPSILLNYIEKNGSNVLILDYREDKRRYIKCNLKNGGEINIVQLEPSTIVLGSLLHCITKTLDISIRPLLEKISQYDFVILLGDLNDITNQNGTKTKILYEALTTYNRTNRLKHPPIILEEGFRGWELTYPCYTSSLEENIPIFEKTFDEMFSHYMEESKRVHRLNFTYPILKSDSETICPSSTKFSKTFSFADKLVPKRVFIDDERSYDNNKISIPVTSFDSTSSKPPQMVSLKNLPLIDRSKKPVVSSIDSKENDDNSIRDKENIIDHPSHINKRLALLPQVLGGARIASAGGPSVTTPAVHHHNNTPQHHHVHTPEVSRPTTPDRSTKKGILQSSQQIEPAAFFTSSYNYSVERILDDSSYKRMKIKPGHTGLVNMGNTCFMNATLQALFHTPYFSQLFRGHAVSNFINTNNTLGTKGIISGCFSALIDIIWSGEFSAIRPFSFLDMFAKRVNSTLADRQQHDAQEFQIYLLDALHEDTNRVNKKRPFEQNYDGSNLLASADDFIKQSRHFSSSPVNDIFNLLTVSVLQCKSCSTRSACFEGLNQISVELPNNNIESGRIFRLKECLNTHFSTTTLDTPWDCPNCKTKQTATRTTKIWSYPKILIIHLKRFSFNSGRFIKNEIDINFEIDNFDLAPYTHTKSTFLQNKVEYNLYAVTNHSGTLNSGHYTSNVKNLQNENEWLHFDDENCTRIRNLSSIVTKHAFLLYYVLGKNVSNDGKNALL